MCLPVIFDANNVCAKYMYQISTLAIQVPMDDIIFTSRADEIHVGVLLGMCGTILMLIYNIVCMICMYRIVREKEDKSVTKSLGLC